MSIDLDAIRAELEKRKKQRSSEGSGKREDFRWVNPPDDGEIRLRFLPAVYSASIPGIVVKRHYSIPEKGSINCLTPYDMKCPICDVVDEYKDRINMEEFEASAQSYFNVLVLGSNKYDPDLPHLFRSSDYTYYWLLENIINPDVGDITDPNTGSTVTFKRKSHKGAFERIIARQAAPIAPTKEEIEKILSRCYNLQEIWKVPDASYINSVIEYSQILDTEMKRRLERLKEYKEQTKVTSEEDVPLDTGRKNFSQEEAKTNQGSLPSEEKDQKPNIEEKPKGEAPAGAPECYGKEHDENSRKCMLCNFEYNCSSVGK